MFKLVVLSVTLALAAASPSGLAGWGWGAPWGAPWGAHLAAPLAAVAAPVVAPAAVAAPLIGHRAYNYRGPLSLAPGQPASILATDGRPLDTLSVNLDRAAHYTAKAVDSGVHVLKKRSAVWGAPAVAWPGAHVVAAPALAPLAPLAVARAAPLPLAPWGVGHVARWGHAW